MGNQLKRRTMILLSVALGGLVMALALRLTGVGLGEPLPTSANGPIDGPVEPGSEQTIDRLQARLQSHPDDAAAYALLGLALLQRVRETAGPTLYNRAETAFSEALEREPNQLDALIGQGVLALARHDFRDALNWAGQALAITPQRAQIYGVMADAQIELGRYDEAARTLQTMVDLRPDLSSYSRIAYLHELHGDTTGAIEAMQRAVMAGGPATENTLWTQVQLGHLYFNQGNLIDAEQSYRRALQIQPDYIHASAGIARVRAAQARYEDAIAGYERIVERLPNPEFVIALGQLYEVTGRSFEAKRQFELVHVIEQLNRAAGMNVDLELALFQADYGSDPSEALRQAQAAYQLRPGIYGADTLAWALYKNGDYVEADRYSREALRLNTRDARLYFHAGMIARAQGQAAEAERFLNRALAINPYFDVLQAPLARLALEQIRQAAGEHSSKGAG
jgi:tetratricopeptide (TPR) repeat protein